MCAKENFVLTFGLKEEILLLLRTMNQKVKYMHLKWHTTYPQTVTRIFFEVEDSRRTSLEKGEKYLKKMMFCGL